MTYRELLHRKLDRRQLLAGAATLMLASCGADGEAHRASDDAPVNEPADAPGLITPGELRELIDDPDLRLIDLSELRDYRGGHIPGAQHCWWQDMIEVHNPIYGMLLNAEGRAELTQQLGVTPTSTVVCYDRSAGVYASRLIWMLEYMGFTTGRVLTGGLQGWEAVGGELVRDRPSNPPPGGIDDIQNEFINAHADDIIARQDEPGLVILDTRTEGERNETWHGALRTGQIPGSAWLPRTRFLAEGDVSWVISAEQMRDALAGAGIDVAATAEIIVYGLHATLACLPYVALKSLDDFHVRLYDGSWAEWGSNPDLEIEPIPAP